MDVTRYQPIPKVFCKLAEAHDQIMSIMGGLRIAQIVDKNCIGKYYCFEASMLVSIERVDDLVQTFDIALIQDNSGEA
jgi:hypothetical protein